MVSPSPLPATRNHQRRLPACVPFIILASLYKCHSSWQPVTSEAKTTSSASLHCRVLGGVGLRMAGITLMGEGAKALPGAATRPGAHWSEGGPQRPPPTSLTCHLLPMAQGGLGPPTEGLHSAVSSLQVLLRWWGCFWSLEDTLIQRPPAPSAPPPTGASLYPRLGLLRAATQEPKDEQDPATR